MKPGDIFTYTNPGPPIPEMAALAFVVLDVKSGRPSMGTFKFAYTEAEAKAKALAFWEEQRARYAPKLDGRTGPMKELKESQAQLAEIISRLSASGVDTENP